MYERISVANLNELGWEPFETTPSEALVAAWQRISKILFSREWVAGRMLPISYFFTFVALRIRSTGLLRAELTFLELFVSFPVYFLDVAHFLLDLRERRAQQNAGEGFPVDAVFLVEIYFLHFWEQASRIAMR